MESDLPLVSIKADLKAKLVGQKVIYYPTLASTMDVARREAQQGTSEGTVVIAGEQTAGRGRIKRTWLSPKGSLAMSIILYPRVVHLSSLIMVASLAVARGIERVTGLRPQIKWPNDILVNGKKVCGILIENGVRGSGVDYSIIGIGVNVNLVLSQFPEIPSTATSLSDELGENISLVDMVRQLLIEMDKLYLDLLAGGAVYEEWRESLVTLGREVQVEAGETVYEGIAESVARDGSLLLRHLNGDVTRIVAGDATLRGR